MFIHIARKSDGGNRESSLRKNSVLSVINSVQSISVESHMDNVISDHNN